MTQYRDKLGKLPAEIQACKRAIKQEEASIRQAEAKVIEARKPCETLEARIETMMPAYLELRRAAGFEVLEPR